MDENPYLNVWDEAEVEEVDADDLRWGMAINEGYAPRYTVVGGNQPVVAATRG